MAETTPESTGNVGRGADVPTLTTGQLQVMERSIRRRYPVTEADRIKSIDACRNVIEHGKSDRAKLRAVTVLALLDSQSMRDEHHIEDKQHEAGILDLRMRRAEEGKPNDCIAVQIAPVKALPLPASLAEYRMKMLEPKEH